MVCTVGRSEKPGLVRWVQKDRRGPPHLSAQEAVHGRDDKALCRVEDGEERLEEDGAAVCHGQDSRHPGECQQGQHHAGAPERCPKDSSKGSVRVTLQETGWAEPRPVLSLEPLICPGLAGSQTPRSQ